MFMSRKDLVSLADHKTELPNSNLMENFKIHILNTTEAHFKQGFQMNGIGYFVIQETLFPLHYFRDTVG